MQRFKYTKWLFYIGFISLMSCGSIVISSEPGRPLPPWFYPNRLEIVRYVYFPEYHIYYDISMRKYLYYDSGAWVRSNALPSRYSHFNLNRSRYIRVRDYHDDDINRYDSTRKRRK